MKKLIIALLIFGLLLCGCTPTQESTTQGTNPPADTSAGSLAGQIQGELEQIEITKPDGDVEIPPQPTIPVYDK